MSKWTSTPQEYDLAREVMLGINGTPEIILAMKDGTFERGRAMGTKVETDVGENLQRGRGPYVTRMTGQIKLDTADGMKIIEAVDVKAFQIVSDSSSQPN